jgi:hypothetical protein
MHKVSSASAITDEHYRKTLQRLQAFARFTDTKFEIPIIKARVGWDPIIGLIPGIGDFIGFLLSSYVVIEALRLKVPKPVIGRMLINMFVEFLGGIVPILGDAFDAYWKANKRNVELLEKYIQHQLAPPPPKKTGALALLLFVVTLIVILLIFRYYLSAL